MLLPAFSIASLPLSLQSISTIEAAEVQDSFLDLSVTEGGGGEETEEEEDSITEPVDQKSQEELINRLMTDGMSFSEVSVCSVCAALAVCHSFSYSCKGLPQMIMLVHLLMSSASSSPLPSACMSSFTTSMNPLYCPPLFLYCFERKCVSVMCCVWWFGEYIILKSALHVWGKVSACFIFWGCVAVHVAFCNVEVLLGKCDELSVPGSAVLQGKGCSQLVIADVCVLF